MPKVTVIIPSYNHEKYVGEAVQSILDQTFQDFELVITDDASTDNSVLEIKKIKDHRIKLFCSKKNQGVSVAINNCLKKAKGKYIAHLNSDDAFIPDKLRKQVAFLDSHPTIAAVFSYAQFIDEDGKEFASNNHPHSVMNFQQNKNRYEWLNYFFYQCRWLWHPSMLIRKDAYERIGLHDERLAQTHDFDLGIRLSINYDIHIIQEKLIKFRIRTEDKNVSAETPGSRARSMYELSQVLRNFLKIKRVSEFKKIFPEEAKKHRDIIDDELIPFFVARAALEVEHVFHKKFGLDTIFNLLGDELLAKKLKATCNFDFVSFIELTGKHDIYNVNQILNQETYIKMLEKSIRELENPILRMKNNIKNLLK